MAFKPTPMQQAAIDSESNVIVAAAAGSGKTAVLTERVIRMLKDENKPVSADRLLIVTFTNAAARQMRSRIEKRLYAEIAKNPNDAALLRQKHLLANADICTIDSFCIKLVRDNFNSLGIKPDFKVGDGGQLFGVRQRVMNELLGGYFMQDDADFEKLLELTGCEYDENNLAEVIERLYSYSLQLPFPNVFLDNLALSYEAAFQAGNVWYDSAFEKAQEAFEIAIDRAEEMQNTASKIIKNSDKFSLYATETKAILGGFLKGCQSKNWDLLHKLLKNIKLKNLPSSEKCDAAAEEFKQDKAFIADSIKSVGELFCLNRADTQLQIIELKGAVRLLIELTKKYAQMLFDAYNEENEFTFSDIEQLALSLLCGENDGEISVKEAALNLADRYDEVLVDEYQDVNDLQDTLFQILSHNGERLFVVGDVKQCIYGFRGSNPINFLNRKNSAIDFSKATYFDLKKATDNAAKKIILAENFRSCKGVCDCVNFFFSLFFIKDFGGMEYGKEEQLIFAADIPQSEQPTVALRMVDAANCDSSEETLLAEAGAIADYIKETMNSGAVIRDENGLRHAQYGDFAILLDKLKGRAEIIADGLRRSGIPIDYSGGEFLETVEISTVLSLLKVIDNPLYDVELLCVMLSPIFNFTAEQLASIRLQAPKTNLFSAVKNAAQAGDKKAEKFCEHLNELRLLAAVSPVDALISSVFRFNDCFDKLCAMSSPNTRKANLLALENIAKEYCKSSKGDVYGFIKFINSLPATAFKPQAASNGGVKIMTMHNSKGLQFPVCIVANCETRFNNADSISAVLFDENFGIGFRYYNEEQDSVINTLAHKVIAYKSAEKSRQERMRLLYVALTRAIDRLCIFSAYNDIEGKLKKTAAQLNSEPPYIPNSVLKGASSMADWILSAAVLHPDCSAVLNQYGIETPKIDTDSRMDIRVVTASEAGKTDSEESGDVIVNEQMAEEIIRNTQFYYPYDELKSIRQKASVSLLANSQESADFAFSSVPDFMTESGLSAAGRGTAMHKIMQFISLEENVSVEQEIERLVEYGFITETEAKVADRKAIKKFFDGPLYKRIAKGQQINREMRFVTEFAIGDIYATDIPQGLEQETVMLQGAIDLCFIEDGKVIILDFKTDRVDSIETLRERYGKQLELYSKACEKIFKLPVAQKVIYSFALSDSIIL